jgi:hypothetical protein
MSDRAQKGAADEVLSAPFPRGCQAPFRGEKGCQAPPLSALAMRTSELPIRAMRIKKIRPALR